MPGFTCCVPGCYNNSQRDRDLRFYTFPKDTTQREIWLKNISRSGVKGCFSTFQPTTGHRVCSVHFAGGRKTYTVRIPTLFPIRGVNEKRSRRGRGRKAAGFPTLVGVISLPQNESPEGAAPDPCGPGAPDGQHDVDTKPVDLTVQSDETCVTAVVSCAAAVTDCVDMQLVESALSSVRGCGLPACSSLDHAYSLPSGTTATDLLKRLNEQRDIIALMEVKMKELKSTLRQLILSEAKLMEEIRERDRLLSKCYSPSS
ncbi:THAP domain-containing protein 11-like [Denticeps clupeoides]|uniref:THAP domain-containing protein 11 n=1 Tax=Denticeps clupeoides TaxID=299321 RepID=A0AAY4ETJ1_9TELE|nr:THAP domain-containing protein 11 [Denticeps clupeoides]